MRAPKPAPFILLAVILAGSLAHPAAAEVDAATRARIARRQVQDARAFLAQGNAEAALRATRRGLSVAGDDAPLLRARARALERLGRNDEAKAARLQADGADPPPQPLPGGALTGSFGQRVIVLLPPPTGPGARGRTADRWPNGPIAEHVERRLQERWPGVDIVHLDLPMEASLPDLAQWLLALDRPSIASLRVDRVLCGESIKDGPYGLASLRLARAASHSTVTQARYAGRVEDPTAQTCRTEVLSRALEDVLAADFAESSGHEDDTLSREALLSLVPSTQRLIDERMATARRALFVGDLMAAEAAYGQALQLDPEHPDLPAHLAEIERTRALEAELSRIEEKMTSAKDPTEGADPRGTPRPRLPISVLSAAQRATLERQLVNEQRRRDDLLAMLTLLGGDRRELYVPESALRPSEIVDAHAKGPARARAWAGKRQGPGPPSTTVVALALATRTLHGPDGRLVARYYTVSGRDEVLLIEEDTRADGELDQWTAYRGGVRRLAWEEHEVDALPNLHVVYDARGDGPARVEFDTDWNGQADRTYQYEGGALVRAETDSDGNGRFDRFETFGQTGLVETREEDLTGDGQIDVRTLFENGRVKTRQIMDPSLIEDGT